VRAPEPAPPPEPVAPLPPATYPAPARLVAIGDVHGDVSAFRSVLRLAGAIDETNHWSGGALVVVQTGDVLDRGDDEPEILDLIAQLEGEAAAAGGRFIALNGNHEIMNAQRDFRYVTPEGFTDFASFRREASREARAELPTDQEGRAGAFEPGRRHARAFAARNTVVVVGNTVFVHGGLAPRYAQALSASTKPRAISTSVRARSRRCSKRKTAPSGTAATRSARAPRCAPSSMSPSRC
jgi:hypothetical protein